MTNKEIAAQLKLLGALTDLHNENPFKARSYANAAFQISRSSTNIANLTIDELEAFPGIGKAIAGKITNLLNGEKIEALEKLLNKTPLGVLEMMQIKGLGPKKLAVLWRDHKIDQINALFKACKEDKLTKMKGFGEKSQAQILASIEFYKESQSKYLYAAVKETAMALSNILSDKDSSKVSLAGPIRRKCEIIEVIDIVIASKTGQVIEKLKGSGVIDNSSIKEQKKIITCSTIDGFPVNIYVTDDKSFWYDTWSMTGNKEHVEAVTSKFKKKNSTFKSEDEIYKSIGLATIPPEMREGLGEFEWAATGKKDLIQVDNLQGILHAHSTYSDGQNTLTEMAEYCMDQGYKYLGITDHSKTAVYAGGLQPKDIENQHIEIDKLNDRLKPFKIFKGIESDILMDGSLDYPDELLQSFEFVIISVHSVLNMKKDQATNRLIKAIEHPVTTILGHATGRLLLRREGYPIDHEKVIDACIANNVVIEINSNPYRLDMDWRWIQYALGKGAIFSINPDAHIKEGIHDVQYGVNMGRKGGLPPEAVLNTYSQKQISKIFKGNL